MPRPGYPEGLRLARWLTDSIGNHQMRTATLMLGFYQDGYWLRRFTQDSALAGMIASTEPETRHLGGGMSLVLSRTSPEPPASIDWQRVADLLRTPELLADEDAEPGTDAPHLAALEIAVSLAAGRPVDLCRAARVLPASDWREILRHLENAATYV